MGMFDTVVAPCPKEGCDGRLEIQTKAGRCLLIDYILDDAPNRILEDIDGETMRCDKCGTTRTAQIAKESRIKIDLI